MSNVEHYWTAQIKQAEKLAKEGAGALALRRLEELSIAHDVPRDILELTHKRVLEIIKSVFQRVDKPVDISILANAQARGAVLPAMRRLPSPLAQLPRSYPFDFCLPKKQNLSGHVPSPPIEAENRLPPGMPASIRKLSIVLSTDNALADSRALTEMLEKQSLLPPLEISVFSQDARACSDSLELIPVSICSPEAQQELNRIAQKGDQLLFIEGGTLLDITALERMCRIAATSNRVVQPLTCPAAGASFQPYCRRAVAEKFPMNLPFRGVRGMNLMVSSALWAEVGGLSPRFAARNVAAVELAYRFFITGAWFVPQQVPQIGQPLGIESPKSDVILYRSLCPNRIDRRSGSGFEVPKVSIYVPAYNSGRFLIEAIHSVLNQDYRDLEVCVHDDGSTDDTLRLLEREFGGEPRVRWETADNGGIGYASNRAIGMSQSLYIGQLDADDRLLPGAVSRLVARLEADPQLACVYSSCERIDADGRFLKPEYEWPVFSHEKLFLTSIVHHFRMFRRQAFARTDGLRTDLRNAVDYDLFLKLAEVGRIEHLPAVLYQRRWHGTNTSLRHETEQSTNTHVVQRASLARNGLADAWELHVADSQKPRNVTYRRRKHQPVVFFWPDYSTDNPYQRLLYEPFRAQGADVCAASPASTIHAIQSGSVDPTALTFHLHWLHFLFPATIDEVAANEAAAELISQIAFLKNAGVRVVWTIHNLLSHESRFPELEIWLSRSIIDLVDLVHLHDREAVDAIRPHMQIPKDKLCIARHGNYVSVYPNHITRSSARDLLGLAEQDDVVLFCGAIRRYKGIDLLISAFRMLRKKRPRAKLLIAGAGSYDPFSELEPKLDVSEAGSVIAHPQYVEPGELQVYFRAADVVALPYRRILTSGSAVMSFGFGCPVILPAQTAPARLLAAEPFALSYEPSSPQFLANAIEEAFSWSPIEKLQRQAAALNYADNQTWPGPDEFPLLQGSAKSSTRLLREKAEV